MSKQLAQRDQRTLAALIKMRREAEIKRLFHRLIMKPKTFLGVKRAIVQRERILNLRMPFLRLEYLKAFQTWLKLFAEWNALLARRRIDNYSELYEFGLKYILLPSNQMLVSLFSSNADPKYSIAIQQQEGTQT